MRTSTKLFVIWRLTCNTKNITYTDRTQAIDLKASYTKSVKIFLEFSYYWRRFFPSESARDSITKETEPCFFICIEKYLSTE